MTYKEIKKRLTQCEVKLTKLQASDSPARKSKNYNTAVEKLQVLKESYEKMLKEVDTDKVIMTTKGGKSYVAGMDTQAARDLFRGDDDLEVSDEEGNKLNERGVQFSKEETAAIAKEVGKAVAKALHNLGDEIDSMKARNLEPNSFEIYVQYKKDGSDDQFSFYISDDTLHLVDFSFDKEIGGVGVKPSGEAIVHVDVLANELVKHFKSLANEGMSDQEYADAKEADRLEKHPEKDTIKKIQALIAAQQKSETVDEDINLHKIEVSIRDAKKAQDIMYDMYDRQFEQNGSNVYLFDDEQTAYDAMMDLASRDIEIENIEDFDEEIHEGEGHHIHGRPVQVNKGEKSDGTDWTVTFTTDTSMAKKGKTVPLHAVLALIEPKPAVTKEGEESDDENTPAIDRMYNSDAWVQAQKDMLENEDEGGDLDDYGRSHSGKDKHTRFSDEEFADMTDPLKRFARFKENKAEDEGGDLDVGHQDDEPDMLKQYAYDIATYAAKLYKQLDKYDQMDAEVDFPNWWQSKVILAKDYISKAQHYLEFEEKQPAIDQLALEENVNESHAKLKREYDALVGKMKQLAQHFKTAEGEKKEKIVAALKQHTARKRELESQIEKAVAGIGVDQELDELFGSKVNYDEIIGPIVKRLQDLKKYVSKKEPDAMDDLQQVIRAFEIFDEKMSYGTHMELEEVNEAKATCCGKCGRVHVKGTKCKRPYLTGKDHCRYN